MPTPVTASLSRLPRRAPLQRQPAVPPRAPKASVLGEDSFVRAAPVPFEQDPSIPLYRLSQLPEALADSLADLDGAYSYLVASPEGLGVVRDRFGFKPLMVAETEEVVAVATEEVALRRALPGDYRVVEPPPCQATLYPLPSTVLV